MIANDDLQIQQTPYSFGFYNQGRFSFAGYLEADIMKKCSVEGCNKKYLAKGYCVRHYAQIKRLGIIQKVNRQTQNRVIIHKDYAEIELYDIHCKPIAYAKIDLEDIEKVKKYRWCSTSRKYVHNIKNRIKLHDIIIGFKGNNKYNVDHINRNPLDNRRFNLRVVSQRENCLNNGIKKNNTSGFSGVSYNKLNGNWTSYITVNYKRIFLGNFKDKSEAIKERKKAEIKYGYAKYRKLWKLKNIR